ncbi:beta-1,3-glucanase family protein, partial [Tistrella bauzanensis]|uniref:beta-1,3-glucanase family protein n=1 Tax=Tistrella bauzanensis TaxID=657419 RepID=UPI00227CCF4D
MTRVVFVKDDATLIYPSSGISGVPVPIGNDVSIPLPAQGSVLSMSLPIPIASGRIYFSQGTLNFSMVKTPNGDGLVQPSVTNLQDPSSAINRGFIEFTYSTDLALWANISYVDFVGLPLGLSLVARDGRTQIIKGLGADSVSRICNSLVEQTEPLRVCRRLFHLSQAAMVACSWPAHQR